MTFLRSPPTALPATKGTAMLLTQTLKAGVRFSCKWTPPLAMFLLTAALTGHIHALYSNGQLLSTLEQYQGKMTSISNNAVPLVAVTLCVLLSLALWLSLGKTSVYLLDFYTFLPPARLAGDVPRFVKGMRACGRWPEESVSFMEKVTQICGVGPRTYFPEEVAAADAGDHTLHTTWTGAKAETEMVLFASIEKLLTKLDISPKQIDAVIVNCTSYNPVPSLSAAIMHHFGMRPTTLGYTLSGQGCAASVISVDLAKELLQNHPNMRVLIAGTENVTSALYFGNVRSMLIANCLFRMCGMAAVMSNCRADCKKAKYCLEHLVRVHLGTDQAYGAVQMQEDEDGMTGVKIGKELMTVAGKALTMNIKRLAPLVLPVSEKIIYACNMIARQVFKAKVGEYVPDFGTAIQHFAIHPGGKAVIDTVEKALSLRPEQSEPCRQAFERFGNTSSSSTWYAWAFAETKQGIKKGDRLWQLAFGSGFKCNSAVWRALKPIKDGHDSWTETPSC